MKRKMLGFGSLACVLLLAGLVVQRWPMARAQPQPQVAVVLASENYTVGEADGTVTITVTLSESSSSTVTVDYVVFSADDDAATAQDDYVALTGTLEFPPGTTSRTIVVQILEDACCEANETFSVALGNPVGASLGSPSTARVTILDNDTCP